jgi:hypothetical protein
MALMLDLSGEIRSDDGEVDCNIGCCPRSSKFDQVIDYASNNGLWMEDFRDIYTRMTLSGHFVCDLTAVEGTDVEELEDCAPTPTGSQNNQLLTSTNPLLFATKEALRPAARVKRNNIDRDTQLVNKYN